MLAYGAVLGFVHLIGGARLALAPPSSETVRVASFTHTPRGLDSWDLIGHRVQGAALDSVRALLRTIRTRCSNGAGARRGREPRW